MDQQNLIFADQRAHNDPVHSIIKAPPSDGEPSFDHPMCPFAWQGRPMPEVAVPLTVRDLTTDDLPAATAWAGEGPREAPERMQRGEVDYLVVCPPSGVPVALGGAIYNEMPGAGTLWQLSVHPALRSCGIGTILIGALEQRIRARGLRRAELGVDEPNVRARTLYERLGYVAYGRDSGTWDRVVDDGTCVTVTMMYTLMRKDLATS